MALSEYERNNCIKTSVEFKMNGSYQDPSGSVAFVDVIKPDGTYLVQDASTTKDGVGQYSYYFQVPNTDPLGIYVVVWKGMHNLGGSYGYKNITNREGISVVHVE